MLSRMHVPEPPRNTDPLSQGAERAGRSCHAPGMRLVDIFISFAGDVRSLGSAGWPERVPGTG